MDKDILAGKRMKYYGEPPQEMIGEITGRIREREEYDVRCRHLRFTGLMLENDAIIFSGESWEERGVVVPSPDNPGGNGSIVDRVDPPDVRFGDFWEIVSLLKPRSWPTDGEQRGD